MPGVLPLLPPNFVSSPLGQLGARQRFGCVACPDANSPAQLHRRPLALTADFGLSIVRHRRLGSPAR
jgi:hypothetical protein